LHHVARSKEANHQAAAMSGLRYRRAVSGVRALQARISFDDHKAQVLPLSELRTPQ